MNTIIERLDHIENRLKAIEDISKKPETPQQLSDENMERLKEYAERSMGVKVRIIDGEFSPSDTVHKVTTVNLWIRELLERVHNYEIATQNEPSDVSRVKPIIQLSDELMERLRAYIERSSLAKVHIVNGVFSFNVIHSVTVEDSINELLDRIEKFEAIEPQNPLNKMAKDPLCVCGHKRSDHSQLSMVCMYPDPCDFMHWNCSCSRFRAEEEA